MKVGMEWRVTRTHTHTHRKTERESGDGQREWRMYDQIL